MVAFNFVDNVNVEYHWPMGYFQCSNLRISRCEVLTLQQTTLPYTGLFNIWASSFLQYTSLWPSEKCEQTHSRRYNWIAPVEYFTIFALSVRTNCEVFDRNYSIKVRILAKKKMKNLFWVSETEFFSSFSVLEPSLSLWPRKRHTAW